VPSITIHSFGIDVILYPRHPVVVLPSNNSRQPAERSAEVSVFMVAGRLGSGTPDWLMV